MDAIGEAPRSSSSVWSPCGGYFLVVDFPSVVKCILSEDGITSLIQFIIAPVTALVYLSEFDTGEEAVLPKHMFRSARDSLTPRSICHILVYR